MPRACGRALLRVPDGVASHRFSPALTCWAALKSDTAPFLTASINLSSPRAITALARLRLGTLTFSLLAAFAYEIKGATAPVLLSPPCLTFAIDAAAIAR
jgi:hypothetical protein